MLSVMAQVARQRSLPAESPKENMLQRGLLYTPFSGGDGISKMCEQQNRSISPRKLSVHNRLMCELYYHCRIYL